MEQDFREVVEAALLKVADNVAKHLINRSGWHQSDKCFQIDLREAEESILTAHAKEMKAKTESP